MNLRLQGRVGCAIALLAFVLGCAGVKPPPADKPVGAVPEVVELGDAAREASIYVAGPGEFGELKGHLERAFLKAGCKVVKTPGEATLVVTVGDAGGSFGTGGIQGGLSFSDTTRKVVATVTADGRQVDETNVESSFTVTQTKGEEINSITKRLSEQSTASWKLIANSIVNSLAPKLGSKDKPSGDAKSL